jgi:ABC-type multidrug transport system ATPase subunit
MRTQVGSVLEVSGLSFGFKPRVLFSGLNWIVPAGVSLIQGGEGTGKTTLLRLIAGDLSPESGNISTGNTYFSKDPGPYRQKVFRTDPRSDTFDALTPAEFFTHWSDQYKGFSIPRATVDFAYKLSQHFGRIPSHWFKDKFAYSIVDKSTSLACS